MKQLKSVFPQSLSEIPFVVTPIEQRQYLAGGNLCEWENEKPITQVFSPVIVGGSPLYLGSYPKFSSEDSLSVLDCAVTAFNKGEGVWPKMSAEERIQVIKNVVSEFPKVREKVVNLLMLETGKEKALAVDEFDRTIKYINDTIVEYQKMSSERIITPRGIVLCVGPFNYPMNEIFEPMFASLIVGNVVLYKHAKYGILMMQPFLEIFQKHFPKGVVNTLYGEGQDTLTPCMKSGKLDAMMFIGSTFVADIVMSSNPNPHGLHGIIGGGAKDVTVITEYTDIDKCLFQFALSAASNTGQRCTATKLWMVHESRRDEFATKFSAMIDSLQIGMPWDVKINDLPLITPMPESGKVTTMLGFVQDAESKGATVTTVNQYIEETLMRPYVLSGVTPDMKIYWEEQFGPVFPITTYKDISEVVDYHVKSEYGQQIAIYDERTIDNPELKQYYIDLFKNHVAKINFNTPCSRGNGTVAFTGKKNSAKGVLSLRDALIEFSQPVVTAGN